MSWNPFSRLSSSATKKTVVSKAEEKEFERDVKRLDDVEELTRRLHKDGKRLAESNNALAKTEHKLTQELLTLALCQSEESFKWRVQEWDAALIKMENHMTDLNVNIHRTVLEPLKKFVSIFPYAQVAVRKREQSLQEYEKCKTKVTKYQDRDRTGPNVVKLETSKKTFNTAQAEFASINETVSEDIPKMVDGRTNYFQPSLEALIKSQVQYTTEAVKVYGELSNTMRGSSKDKPNHDYESQIQQSLNELRALAITTD